jgi:hypothetical protein
MGDKNFGPNRQSGRYLCGERRQTLAFEHTYRVAASFAFFAGGAPAQLAFVRKGLETAGVASIFGSVGREGRDVPYGWVKLHGRLVPPSD